MHYTLCKGSKIISRKLHGISIHGHISFSASSVISFCWSELPLWLATGTSSVLSSGSKKSGAPHTWTLYSYFHSKPLQGFTPCCSVVLLFYTLSHAKLFEDGVLHMFSPIISSSWTETFATQKPGSVAVSLVLVDNWRWCPESFDVFDREFVFFADK